MFKKKRNVEEVIKEATKATELTKRFVKEYFDHKKAAKEKNTTMDDLSNYFLDRVPTLEKEEARFIMAGLMILFHEHAREEEMKTAIEELQNSFK